MVRLTLFSKLNRRVQFIVFEKFTTADLSQIAQEKSCDYLLIIHIQNFYTTIQADVKHKDVFDRSLTFSIPLRSCYVNLDTASEIYSSLSRIVKLSVLPW